MAARRANLWEFAILIKIGDGCSAELAETVELLHTLLDCPGSLTFYTQPEFVEAIALLSTKFSTPCAQRTLAYQLWHFANSVPPNLPPSGQPPFPPLPPPPLPVSADTLASSLALALQKPSARKSCIFAEAENDEDSGTFDLARFLRNASAPHGGFGALDLGWFSDSRRLTALDSETRKRGSSVVASTGFEEWNPQWLGLDQPTSVKKSLHTDRTKNMEASGLAKILGNINTFWLSHAAVGVVSIPAVYSHLLCLIKLADERSVRFAILYERRLTARILERIRSGERFRCSQCIEKLDTRIIDRLDIEESRSARLLKTPTKDKAPDARPKYAAPSHSGAKVTQRRRSPSKPRGSRQTPPKAPAARRERTPPRATRRERTPPRAEKKQVCLDHDPSSRRSCPLGSRCPKDHLDTKDPALKARFDKILQLVEARRVKSSG